METEMQSVFIRISRSMGLLKWFSTNGDIKTFQNIKDLEIIQLDCDDVVESHDHNGTVPSSPSVKLAAATPSMGTATLLFSSGYSSRVFDIDFNPLSLRDKFVQRCIEISPSIQIKQGGIKMTEPTKSSSSNKHKQKNCVCCHKEFSLRRRRYTCKWCNNVICSSCSPHRLQMRRQSAEDVIKRARICQVCNQEIKRKRVDANFRPIVFELSEAKSNAWIASLGVMDRLKTVSLDPRVLSGRQPSPHPKLEKRSFDAYGFPILPADLLNHRTKQDVDGPNHSQNYSAWANELMNNPYLKFTAELRELLGCGVPNGFRGYTWLRTSGAHALKTNAAANYYNDLLNIAVGLMSAENVNRIDTDLHKTFVGHKWFDRPSGIISLRRILICYSIRNPTFGYQNNMNLVAAVLLLFMEEEDAFWAFATIVEHLTAINYDGRRTSIVKGSAFKGSLFYFQYGSPGCIVDQMVFGELLRDKYEQIHSALESLSITPRLLTSTWFNQLFINILPIDVTLRVWDLFLSEGPASLFRAALAIFHLNKKSICSSESIAELSKALQQFSKEKISADEFVDIMQSIDVSSERIDKLRSRFSMAIDAPTFKRSSLVRSLLALKQEAASRKAQLEKEEEEKRKIKEKKKMTSAAFSAPDMSPRPAKGDLSPTSLRSNDKGPFKLAASAQPFGKDISSLAQARVLSNERNPVEEVLPVDDVMRLVTVNHSAVSAQEIGAIVKRKCSNLDVQPAPVSTTPSSGTRQDNEALTKRLSLRVSIPQTVCAEPLTRVTDKVVMAANSSDVQCQKGSNSDICESGHTQDSIGTQSRSSSFDAEMSGVAGTPTSASNTKNGLQYDFGLASDDVENPAQDRQHSEQEPFHHLQVNSRQDRALSGSPLRTSLVGATETADNDWKDAASNLVRYQAKTTPKGPPIAQDDPAEFIDENDEFDNVDNDKEVSQDVAEQAPQLRAFVYLSDKAIGFVSVSDADTLLDIRLQIYRDVDGAPDCFVFEQSGEVVPVSDEESIQVQVLLPQIHIRELLQAGPIEPRATSLNLNSKQREKKITDLLSPMAEFDANALICASAICYHCREDNDGDDAAGASASPQRRRSQREILSNDDKVVIGELAWHSDCFICAGDCGQNLDGLPCCMHEGAPFCTKEYAERFAPSCCVCLEGVAEAGVSIESAVLRYIDGRLKSPKEALIFHQSCIKCKLCDEEPAISGTEDRALILCGPGEHDGDSDGKGTDRPHLELYCNNHFLLLSERCARCFETVSVLDKFVRMTNHKQQVQTFHYDCFSCSTCGVLQALNKSVLLHPTTPGLLYCSEHVPDELCCPSCKQPVFLQEPTDKLVSFQDRIWHSKCLRCSKCDPASPSTGKLYSRDGRALCLSHFEAAYCDVCHSCGEAIVSGGVMSLKSSAKEFKFHQKCFVCCQCKTPVSTQMRFIQEKLFCVDHASDKSREVAAAKNPANNNNSNNNNKTNDE